MLYLYLDVYRDRSRSIEQLELKRTFCFDFKTSMGLISIHNTFNIGDPLGLYLQEDKRREGNSDHCQHDISVQQCSSNRENKPTSSV